MISVIICSVNPQLLNNVTANIKSTIGVPFEIIAIDNRNTGKGICKVYNEAAEKAMYDFLCFVHEDVIFHTKAWGGVLIQLLKDLSNVLVGVSGAVYKSDIPGSWVACQEIHYRANTLQHIIGLAKPGTATYNPLQEKYSKVAVIDGVFMGTRKSLWSLHKFDDKLLNGFHAYDLDFSLSLGTSGSICVSHEILLEHFSEGSFSSLWLHDTIQIHKKWKNSLPCNKLHPSKRDRDSDYISCVALLSHLLKQNNNRLKVIQYYLLLNACFFRRNRLRFTKSVFCYLFGLQIITNNK